VAKLNDDFYRASVAVRNNAGAQRLIESLEDYNKQMREELVSAEGIENISKIQGAVKAFDGFLKAFYSADEHLRRIDKNSEGKGPSLATIT
jgi:hypothetical protein